MKSDIQNQLQQHLDTAHAVIASLLDDIEAACRLFTETVGGGKRVLLFGNGGSAADAQHIAAELTGRFKLERRALPAIALTTDTSALTAIGNDYGYERVFARQVEALAGPGDLLIGLSTSGNSENVNQALAVGKGLGASSLGLTGKDGGAMKTLCDLCLVVPSNDTARIQEMHILIGHILCQQCENCLFAPGV